MSVDANHSESLQGIRNTLLEWSRYYLGYPRPPSRVNLFSLRSLFTGFQDVSTLEKCLNKLHLSLIKSTLFGQPPAMPWMELFQLDFESEAKVGMRESDSAFKVEVKPFIGYHPSVYGIKVFLRKHGILPPAGFQSEPKSYN
ncbi:hypothetical protein Gasu2_30590 [Galdieria sulphuraria]|nr:hypothetical protein Gasu2_30590 [Galdieria sulphuraria]